MKYPRSALHGVILVLFVIGVALAISFLLPPPKPSEAAYRTLLVQKARTNADLIDWLSAHKIFHSDIRLDRELKDQYRRRVPDIDRASSAVIFTVFPRNEGIVLGHRQMRVSAFYDDASGFVGCDIDSSYEGF